MRIPYSPSKNLLFTTRPRGDFIILYSELLKHKKFNVFKENNIPIIRVIYYYIEISKSSKLFIIVLRDEVMNRGVGGYHCYLVTVRF
jgi:hypothetical protein